MDAFFSNESPFPWVNCQTPNQESLLSFLDAIEQRCNLDPGKMDHVPVLASLAFNDAQLINDFCHQPSFKSMHIIYYIHWHKYRPSIIHMQIYIISYSEFTSIILASFFLMSVETLFCCTPRLSQKNALPGRSGFVRFVSPAPASVSTATTALATSMVLRMEPRCWIHWSISRSNTWWWIRKMRGLVGWWNNLANHSWEMEGCISWIGTANTNIYIYILCVHVFPCLNIPTGVRSAGFIDQPELQLLQLYITL